MAKIRHLFIVSHGTTENYFHTRAIIQQRLKGITPSPGLPDYLYPTQSGEVFFAFKDILGQRTGIDMNFPYDIQAETFSPGSLSKFITTFDRHLSDSTNSIVILPAFIATQFVRELVAQNTFKMEELPQFNPGDFLYVQFHDNRSIPLLIRGIS